MGRGYNPNRFINPVRQDFLCCICLCVIKDPRTCEQGEHYFCFFCITRHLANSPTCPECRHLLTSKTLKRPHKFLALFLSELKIKCDYFTRGCLEQVELGNLQNHVNHCEYRPITCENCHFEVNAKDEDNHKKSSCHLGDAISQSLLDIKKRQADMEAFILTVSAKQKENEEEQDKVKRILKGSSSGIKTRTREVDGQISPTKRLGNEHDEKEKLNFRSNKMGSNPTLQRQQPNNAAICYLDSLKKKIYVEPRAIKRKNNNEARETKVIKKSFRLYIVHVLCGYLEQQGRISF